MITLGATRGPLDQSVTVPGIGLVVSVRSVLQMLCAAADIDKALCKLIEQKPDQACKSLVAMGDKWLHDKVAKAFDKLVARVLEGVDCQRHDWKDVVIDSLDVSFSDSGIEVEIDTDAMVQMVICQIARKAVSLAIEPAINTVVRQLKNACSQLSSSSTPSAPKPPASSTATTPKVVAPDFTRAAGLVKIGTRTSLVKAALAAQKPPASKAPLFAAAGITLAFGGAAWWLFNRRR